MSTTMFPVGSPTGSPAPRSGGYYCDLRHKARHAVDGMPVDGFGEPDDWVIPVAQAA